MPLRITLLCAHHTLDGFDCGKEALNDVIADRVGRRFDRYDPAASLTIVAEEDLRIRGYINLTDYRMSLEQDGIEALCLFASEIGVTSDAQGKNIAARLYKRAEAILKLRLARQKKYAAMLATVVHNEDFGDRLARMGFRPVPNSSLLWIKPIPELWET